MENKEQIVQIVWRVYRILEKERNVSHLELDANKPILIRMVVDAWIGRDDDQ